MISNRIFPIKYWADRSKFLTIEELWDIEKLFEENAILLIGIDLYLSMCVAIDSVKKDPPVHFKPKYPFWWSCIK